MTNTDRTRYFGDHDIDGMFATLNPLHDLLVKASFSRFGSLQ